MSADTTTNTDPETHFKSGWAPIFVMGTALFAILWGIANALLIKKIDMTKTDQITELLTKAKGAEEPLIDDDGQEINTEYITGRLTEIGEKITAGAISFLSKEYLYLGLYSAVVAVVLGLTVDLQEMSRDGDDEFRATNFPYTAVAYLVGSGTSILAGYVGMRIAVYTNTRTTFQCCTSAHAGFLAAFRGGQVLGFCLVGLALFILQLLIFIYRASWYDKALEAVVSSKATDAKKKTQIIELTSALFELIAGYGLGGSSVALFGRVGGGIYTKAADVGADLVGKTLKDLKEDDPSNPGTIADNVGDNVGDIAGMGADLFGSLAESTCAALVVSATSWQLITTPDALYFPLMVTASGIVASFVSVLFVHAVEVTKENVQTVLKAQIGISTVLMTLAVIPSLQVLPPTFTFLVDKDLRTDADAKQALIPYNVTRWQAYGCIMFGLWSGMVIGFITEYYTSNAYGPTLALADACKNGPAPNIILGLALGYASVVIPILCITATIAYSFSVANMYGIGLAALGMLGSLPVALSIDGYGPISDNAGGVAEMSGLPGSIRELTDALDAAGNTTAAVGKGFAIGSACLVGLALFGAFITRVQDKTVDILRPAQFAGLLVGAMLPYAFSALTMQAVGDAANDMMDFIIQDYNKREEEKIEQAKLKDANPDHQIVRTDPDYDGCIRISTEASLRKMVLPGLLVVASPLVAGFLFGPPAVAGLLAGAIVSGVQVAISASNTGGAWDNAKKETEKRRRAHKAAVSQKGQDIAALEAEYKELESRGEEGNARGLEIKDDVIKQRECRERHVAAVVGDTVGDPLKDTSGPAINILIKLSAITSLVFGSYIKQYHAFETEQDIFDAKAGKFLAETAGTQ